MAITITAILVGGIFLAAAMDPANRRDPSKSAEADDYFGL